MASEDPAMMTTNEIITLVEDHIGSTLDGHLNYFG